MSRFRLEFDPDGYTYASEPGVDWQIDGDQLATRTAPAANGESAPFLGPRDNFWHAPGTVWIGTKPRQFDASWNRGSPFQFQLGAGQVIAGWDQGVQGMKVGGRRQLTIPAHLAYGNQSPTPAIKPGETLIFVVDLLGVS